MQEPKSLEDLTGLTQLHAETLRMQQQAEERAAEAVEAGDHSDGSGSIPDIEDEWTLT